ncbi:sulfotransferase family 2 domain-containing protein [Rhizobium sp. PAMB 3182]
MESIGEMRAGTEWLSSSGLMSRRSIRLQFAKALLLSKPLNFRIFYDEDHVAFFPKLGLCFNRIKKSGNTSIAARLLELENGVTASPDFKQQIRNPMNVSLIEASRYDNLFSFAISRNPYTRALSCYLDKVGRGRHERYRLPGFGMNNREGFTLFLEALQSDVLAHNRHFWPQYNLLFQPIEKYGHIGKIENIVEEMHVLFRKCGLNTDWAQSFAKPHSVEAGTTKITSARDRLETFYDSHNIQLVQDIYSDDFVNFRYSMNFEDAARG